MSDRRTRKVQALLEKFRSVAKERLVRLNNAFLKLETNPEDQQASSVLLREIHTLKGEAKLMGFQKVNIVAHKTEDLIFSARDQGYQFSDEVAQSILSGLDLIEALMESGDDAAQARLEETLDTFLSQADALLAEGPSSSSPAATGLIELRDPKAAIASSSTTAPSVAPTAAAGEVADQSNEDKVPPDAAGPRRATIRVDVERLDFLADRVADIARYHTQLEQGFESVRRLGQVMRREGRSLERDLRSIDQDQAGAKDGISKAVTQFLSSLRENNDELLEVASRGQEVVFTREYGLKELETSVKALRLVPLHTLFGRYPRALRDLAKEQGKQVRLTTEGGDLEVDNRVLENLEEPLLHIFRNAIDHGIEGPEERRDAGKPAEGHVHVTTHQGGSHVEIAVADDGRGLLPSTIVSAALRRGLITEGEADAMPTSDIIRLVLRPGFSTRDQATDVSGRGVGLDVVRERVESLGGSVGVSGAPGVGTTIRLRVPISVALMPALVIRIGEVALAIPSHAITAIVDAEGDQLEPVSDRWAIRFNGRHIPVENLPALLGQEGVKAVDESLEDDVTRVLVVEDQGRLLGLMGARVAEERELTLRPLDAFLRDLHVFIGTAILDYGEPALVVSVSELMRRAELGLHPAVERSRRAAATAQRSIVLVEDSEIVRDMLEGMLRGFGYIVLEAANGRDALVHLERHTPDLIVTDLEMPVMDGFELIKQVRALPKTADVPIVVLTSRGSAEDKRRAGELGADAYLVKSAFSEDVLAETLHRFFRAEGARR